VREDEGGEAEVEQRADLVRGGASELLVNAVLDGPDGETGEEEEGEADEPEVVAERLEEHPGVLAALVADRHHHGDGRRHEWQREVHQLRPARRHGDVRHRRVVRLPNSTQSVSRPNEICSKSLAQTFHSESPETYSPCRKSAEAADQPVAIIL
jgi:hypothetical protein